MCTPIVTYTTHTHVCGVWCVWCLLVWTAGHVTTCPKCVCVGIWVWTYQWGTNVITSCMYLCCISGEMYRYRVLDGSMIFVMWQYTHTTHVHKADNMSPNVYSAPVVHKVLCSFQLYACTCTFWIIVLAGGFLGHRVLKIAQTMVGHTHCDEYYQSASDELTCDTHYM